MRTHDLTYISLTPILLHRIMEFVDNSVQVASQAKRIEGSVQGTVDESRTVFAEEEPSPQKKMRRTGKSSKKKKQKLEAEGNVIEKKPRKGRREPEKNTTEEMLRLDGYKTIDGESSTTRTNHPQRNSRYWVKKWFNYQRIHPHYDKRFAFTSHGGDCVAKNCLKRTDPKMRPLPVPVDVDPSSLKTPEDYPDELKKRAENAKKKRKKVEKKALKEKLNIELTKQDIERKKELGLSEGRSKKKHDHDGSAVGPSKQRKKPAKKPKKAVSEGKASPVEFEEHASSLVDESVDVNITSDITPPPKGNSEGVYWLRVNEGWNTHADLNAAIPERNDIDSRKKSATTEFIIQVLEAAYLNCNKSVTLLQRKKVGLPLQS